MKEMKYNGDKFEIETNLIGILLKKEGNREPTV